MAIFFAQKTVDVAVDAELCETQSRVQQQITKQPYLQAVWQQHAEKCDAAKEGLVVEGRKEDGKGAEQLYGKSEITVSCSCRQVLYTVDAKGNLKAQEAKQNTETTSYVTSAAPSSLYRDNQK